MSILGMIYSMSRKHKLNWIDSDNMSIPKADNVRFKLELDGIQVKMITELLIFFI